MAIFLADPLGFNVPSTCLDKGRLRLRSDRSLREVYLKVMRAKGTITQNKWLEYQTELGVGSNEKYHPLLRDELLTISTIMFDGQHVYVSEGSFTAELTCFFEHLEVADVGLGFQDAVA